MYIGVAAGSPLCAGGRLLCCVRTPRGRCRHKAEVAVRNCAIGQAQCKVAAGPRIDGPTQSPIMLARQGRRHRLVMRVLARVSGTPEGSQASATGLASPAVAWSIGQHFEIAKRMAAVAAMRAVLSLVVKVG